MKKNVGRTDKIIRFLIAGVLALLILTEVVTGIWSIVFGILAIIALVTSITGFCGLYKIFGINTCSVQPKDELLP